MVNINILECLAWPIAIRPDNRTTPDGQSLGKITPAGGAFQPGLKICPPTAVRVANLR